MFHDPGQVIGEYRKSHLGGYFGKCFSQEVCRPHAGLYRAERMLDRLATLAHGERVRIKALLHGVEQMLMLPSWNPPLWPCRAPRFERTVLTGCGLVPGPSATTPKSVIPRTSDQPCAGFPSSCSSSNSLVRLIRAETFSSVASELIPCECRSICSQRAPPEGPSSKTGGPGREEGPGPWAAGSVGDAGWSSLAQPRHLNSEVASGTIVPKRIVLRCSEVMTACPKRCRRSPRVRSWAITGR